MVRNDFTKAMMNMKFYQNRNDESDSAEFLKYAGLQWFELGLKSILLWMKK